MVSVNYTNIKALFLDVGNTLITMDFQWISQTLQNLGVICGSEGVLRAEAAARPILSAKVHEARNDPAFSTRRFYFYSLLQKLPLEEPLTGDRLDETVRRLMIDLFPEGSALRLWSRVIPGTLEALERFKALGLPMHVISNSDGTVEEQLIQNRLRDYFGEVVDSHVVRVEKPDPRIFEMALERAGFSPRETLYVGDMYHIDILGARSAGMQAALLDPYSDWDGLPCDRVPDLSALADQFALEKHKPEI